MLLNYFLRREVENKKKKAYSVELTNEKNCIRAHYPIKTCALRSFRLMNQITNINNRNNVILWEDKSKIKHYHQLAVGSYAQDQIFKQVQDYFKRQQIDLRYDISDSGAVVLSFFRSTGQVTLQMNSGDTTAIIVTTSPALKDVSILLEGLTGYVDTLDKSTLNGEYQVDNKSTIQLKFTPSISSSIIVPELFVEHSVRLLAHPRSFWQSLGFPNLDGPLFASNLQLRTNDLLTFVTLPFIDVTAFEIGSDFVVADNNNTRMSYKIIARNDNQLICKASRTVDFTGSKIFISTPFMRYKWENCTLYKEPYNLPRLTGDSALNLKMIPGSHTLAIIPLAGNVNEEIFDNFTNLDNDCINESIITFELCDESGKKVPYLHWFAVIDFKFIE